MADHKLELGDATEANDPVEITVRSPFIVIAESGLFKNGKQYDKGSTIELDSRTGANFVAAGDVEAVEQKEAK